MNRNNKILNLLSKIVLKKNKKFKGAHNGESCYIFGNGASIKYFDLGLFSDRVSIGCGSLFLHRDFHKLDLKYYYMGHPFLFYRYWKNQYKKKYERNNLGKLWKKNIELNPSVEYFVSLSNYFGIRGDNINYIHHFGQASDNPPRIELDNVLSTMDGAMGGMIGMAIYMGFKNITLVGCDYTYKPRSQGHFFEFGKFPDSTEKGGFSKELLSYVKNKVNIQTLTIDDNYVGDILNHISYEELLLSKPNYQENRDIVSKDNLNKLNRANMEYNIF